MDSIKLEIQLLKLFITVQSPQLILLMEIILSVDLGMVKLLFGIYQLKKMSANTTNINMQSQYITIKFQIMSLVDRKTNL